MANKHTIVVIVSIIIIASSLGYSSLNLVSASNLQFKWTTDFDFLSVLYGKNMLVCNDSDYPASFSKYEFTIFYDSDQIGKFATSGIAVQPHSEANISGKFAADDKQVSQIFFSFLDTEIRGTDVTRIDADKMKVVATLDYSLFWVIPLSTTHEYSGQEFLDLMNKDTNC
ncbi:MAG: hypothetical protein HZA84_04055 [Thaumarchaeota archaeon]|nr:hypothetical protein [Nitrososphaerota archaeon]